MIFSFYFITGLFHTQDVTLSETSARIICTFADSSNALGCRIVLLCFENFNMTDKTVALCDFNITKESSSNRASRILPSDCCNSQSCSTLSVYAYDILDDGTIPSTAAKNVINIPHKLSNFMSCSTFSTSPSESGSQVLQITDAATMVLTFILIYRALVRTVCKVSI